MSKQVYRRKLAIICEVLTCIETEHRSISGVARICRLNSAHAKRMLEALEAEGYVLGVVYPGVSYTLFRCTEAGRLLLEGARRLSKLELMV